MVTDKDWVKITNELKKNIEPSILKSGIVLTVNFEDLVKVFRGVLNKTGIDDKLDGRSDIEDILKIRFVDGNLNMVGITLNILSTKLEGYLKKVFKIVGQPLPPPGQGMLAYYLKNLFRIFKNLGHQDFTQINENFITAFFDSSNRNYNNPDYFKGMHKLGNHFKYFYTSRNDESHNFENLEDVLILTALNSILITYLYITYLYESQLKEAVVHSPNLNSISHWNIFKSHCNNFDKRQAYFLISDKLALPKDQMAHFANIKWDFIFDLNIRSHVDGLLSSFQAPNFYGQAIYQIIHTSDNRERLPSFPEKTTFWYFCKGNEAIQLSLVGNLYSAWRTLYGRYTQEMLIRYYEENFSKKSTTVNVIILSTEKDYIREILYAIRGINTKLSINFIFANEDNSSLEDLIAEIAGIRVDISLQQVAEGYRSLSGIIFGRNFSNEVFLPCISAKGKSITIPKETANLIRQYFNIVHLNILRDEPEIQSEKTFYQGRTISWNELDNNFDVNRNITPDITNTLRSWLNSRTDSGIFYLIHHAGSGGTTVARRVAYNLHEEYPVLLLSENISNYGENNIVERLLQIFQFTELPSLVIVDNSSISRQQIENLARVAENRLAKAIFLIVESSFTVPAISENVFYLSQEIERTTEQNRFIAKFSKEFENKNFKGKFEKFLGETAYSALVPFYFGLIAYEKDYINIEKYVRVRIQNINDKERDLLLLLSFCNLYANGKLREVPHFVISNFLNIDENFIILNKHVNNPKIFDLIIETEPDQHIYWKTIHPLISQQILRILFGTNESETVNPFALKTFCIKLIDSLRELSNYRNSEVLSLLYSLFIQRLEESGSSIEVDESDTNTTRDIYNDRMFSKLINDLLLNSNRIDVFTHLISQFPDEEPHFLVHFSRLYSVDKNFPKALESINAAIALDADDYILYHIKGMCFRTELYRLIDQYYGKTNDISDEIIFTIKKYFNDAEEEFFNTRESAPNKEHGYVSYIQMVIKMIDFGFSLSVLKNPQRDYTQFITSIANEWYRSILTEADNVIKDYEKTNPEIDSPNINRRKIQLLKFYGEKERMINAWQGLMNNQNYDQNLVRRQLAYAYLAKYGFDWLLVKGKDLLRIQELTEENLRNQFSVRDLQLWFDVSRRLKNSIRQLIDKLEELEFVTEKLDTAYYLMALYAIESMIGGAAGSTLDSYEKYQRKIKQRINNPYSKVFCSEWIGLLDNNISLINFKEIGKWSRERQFFEEFSASKLMKLNGTVVNYIGTGQGFIEIDGSGIQVIYQPAKFNHFSTDAENKTKVTLYVGFNYDGARGFEIENLSKKPLAKI